MTPWDDSEICVLRPSFLSGYHINSQDHHVQTEALSCPLLVPSFISSVQMKDMAKVQVQDQRALVIPTAGHCVPLLIRFGLTQHPKLLTHL